MKLWNFVSNDQIRAEGMFTSSLKAARDYIISNIRISNPAINLII